MPIDPNLLIAGATAAGSLFGGGNRPDPNYSYGYTGGSSFGQSGSSNASQSTSSSFQNPASVWGVQSPYLSDLYGQAQNQFNTGGNQAQAQQMWNQGATGIESLLNPGPNPLMEVYQRQMQQGLEQNILPTIRREAMQGNMIGGTRQGVAEGLALQESVNAQSEFAARLYNEDRNRQLGAVGLMPGYMQAGLGIPWYGLNQYAGILGSPTVLAGGGGSVSQSTGVGSSFGLEGSESFGETFGGPDANNPYAPGAPVAGGVPGGSSGGGVDLGPGYNDRFGNN